MDKLPVFAELLERGFSEEAVILSSELKIICANEAFQKACGLSGNELAGKYCHQILKGCRESCVASIRECPIHEIITTGAPVSMTSLDSMVNGRRRHFMIDIYPIRPGCNEPVSFLHITRDISNHIEEERFKEMMWTEILGRMEQIYTSMLKSSKDIDTAHQEIDYLTETIPMALVRWDQGGSITQWNSSAEILFGWRAQEIIGEPFVNIFSSGREQENFRKIFTDMIKGRPVAYSLSENRTASGRIINCEWHHSSLFEKKGGRIAGGLSLAQDVTERFSIEKDLADTRTELTALLKNTEEAIIAVNHFGRIIVWNNAAENLFGWLQHEMLGRQVEQLIPAELMAQHRETIAAYFQQVRENSIADQCFEVSAKHRDSSAIPVRVKLVSACLEGKSAIIGIIWDISPQRRMEKVLADTRKIREMGELASGMVHDFNNLMAVIKGNVQFLRENISDATLMSRVGAIEKAVNDGSSKASAIQRLAVADIDPESQATGELIDVNELVLAAIDFTRYRWKDQSQKEGHTIVVSTDLAELPLVALNRKIIQDALINLIFNAIDAMPSGGRIHIVSRFADSKLVLQIEDNGQGISRENLPQMFNPFFTTKKSGHSGLGLYSVRKNVSRLGGTVRAESSFGIGTTLTMTFPVKVISTLPERKASAAQDVEQRQILVVDDDAMIASIIADSCRQAGYTVSAVSNGRAGMQQLREQAFDLLITDLGMPDMAGDELVKRARDVQPDLAVIMLTGWGAEVDRSRLHRLGVAELIGKPFDLHDLLQKITTVTAKA